MGLEQKIKEKGFVVTNKFADYWGRIWAVPSAIVAYATLDGLLNISPIIMVDAIRKAGKLPAIAYNVALTKDYKALAKDIGYELLTLIPFAGHALEYMRKYSKRNKLVTKPI